MAFRLDAAMRRYTMIFYRWKFTLQPPPFILTTGRLVTRRAHKNGSPTNGLSLWVAATPPQGPFDDASKRHANIEIRRSMRMVVSVSRLRDIRDTLSTRNRHELQPARPPRHFIDAVMHAKCRPAPFTSPPRQPHAHSSPILRRLRHRLRHAELSRLRHAATPFAFMMRITM